MDNEKMRRQAEAYARATTSARCGSMGKCEGCSVKYCDYRTRLEAFLTGFKAGSDGGKREEL